ncbi:hypothetical protein U9M48_021229 [Paspalum notatum var. saurae]|uniref:Uncharacterized protein n=1 Tax=Paspalum notatum var. saurae TaxID=547442 RepID=A0AAQ3TJZ2_PASNO
MDAVEPTSKFAALHAELAAKSSRVAELEARVSLLEAENACLRKALATREATDCTGEEDPIPRRSEADLGGGKHAAPRSVACGVIEVSDDEEGTSLAGEVGVVAAPTPRKRVVTRESEDEEEADVEDAEGGGGSSNNNGNSADLEDDDVSVKPRGKRRAAGQVVTSDSEDDDVNDGEVGRGDDDADDQGGVTLTRKRRLSGVSDSEDEDGTDGVCVPTSKDAGARIESEEDGTVPIRQVLKKMRKRGGELGEAKGCSAPTTRRSARLVKSQPKGGPAACRFVEPKEYEGSEDDMEEDDDMDEFINDEESSENTSDSAEESCDEPEVSATSVLDEGSSPGPEESGGIVDYVGVMDSLGRKKKANDWTFEGDMLAAFDRHPELCLKAVCALYRKQTKEEQMEKSNLVHNKQGFSRTDAPRASCIAEFLLDGDPGGPLKKNIQDLEDYDRRALAFCRKVASHYSKQLFAIYQNKEDCYFHP